MNIGQEKEEEIYGIIPQKRDKPYKVREIISRLVDQSEFEEYKELYGQSIVTGSARIDGWAVGIIANQRKYHRLYLSF